MDWWENSERLGSSLVTLPIHDRQKDKRESQKMKNKTKKKEKQELEKKIGKAKKKQGQMANETTFLFLRNC